jgi:hypothetical protein
MRGLMRRRTRGPAYVLTYQHGTVIIGGDRIVQGLSGKTGSTLKITFQAENDNNNMARIEISDKP